MKGKKLLVLSAIAILLVGCKPGNSSSQNPSTSAGTSSETISSNAPSTNSSSSSEAQQPSVSLPNIDSTGPSSVVQGQGSAEAITYAWQAVDDIKDHMLNFMENHDEQRIASQFFAGDAEKGFPAMAVSTLMNASPIMVYAGQELGENAHEAEGFSGFDGRTTIFDYWKVESLCSLPKIYGKEQCTMHNAQCTIILFVGSVK